MNTVFEISTPNYADNLLLLKKSLSHMETLVGSYNGYFFSEPSSKFGWTFFKLIFKPILQQGIEKKFSDMLDKYKLSNSSQKFAKFMADYFQTKGCNIRIKILD
jgi:DNA-binding cell septation regulator SpoVG